MHLEHLHGVLLGSFPPHIIARGNHILDGGIDINVIKKKAPKILRDNTPGAINDFLQQIPYIGTICIE